jgi:type I restriction enzyme S subunit
VSLKLGKSAWKSVAFGDVIESITDRVDSPSEAGVDRYVGLEHLDPGVMTVQRWDSPDKVEAQKLRFQPGDVIFGRRRAYQKKVARAEFEGICSAHALVLRARPDCVDPEFLPVFLSSDYFLERAIEISVGSLSPTVNWRDLEVQEFDLPPLDEQKRLADLLWAVERDRVAQAQIELRLGAAEAALARTIADQTNELVVLGDVLDTILDRRGITPGKLGGEFVDEGVPVLSAMNVVNGSIDRRRQQRYVSDDVARQWMSGWLLAGDILMTSEAPLGSTVFLREDVQACLGQRLFALRPDRGRVLPEYLYAWLSSSAGQAALNERSSGTTVKGIRQAELVKIAVPLPGIPTQRDFLSRWRSIQEARSLFSTMLSATKTLRNSILTDVFGRN